MACSRIVFKFEPVVQVPSLKMLPEHVGVHEICYPTVPFCAICCHVEPLCAILCHFMPFPAISCHLVPLSPFLPFPAILCHLSPGCPIWSHCPIFSHFLPCCAMWSHCPPVGHLHPPRPTVDAKRHNKGMFKWPSVQASFSSYGVSFRFEHLNPRLNNNLFNPKLHTVR